MARQTRSKRLALDSAGKDTNDLTQAVVGTYQYLEPDPADGEKSTIVAEITFDPDKLPAETVRALAIFGFHTHCGNWVNKAVNTDGLKGADVVDRLSEYRQMLEEGGWTNRRGEAEAGAAIYIKALARVRGVDEERVAAAWEGWDDDTKDAVKKDDQVKAAVADIRAERARERAKGKESGLAGANHRANRPTTGELRLPLFLSCGGALIPN